MSLKKDESGRRSVQVEVEVPGSPEEVWQAIATGPGISAWFVPTVFEEKAGKPVSRTMSFGPGMDAVAKVTKWDPPHRFAAEGELAPGSPPMATEWTVEAKAGGTCVVRVVHSLFASTDDWDNQLEGIEQGWPGFFKILRVYLTHFRGMPCTSTMVMAFAQGSEAEAWKTSPERLLSPASRMARGGKRLRVFRRSAVRSKGSTRRTTCEMCWFGSTYPPRVWLRWARSPAAAPFS